MRRKHILVATDFGDSSEHAEALAVELATALDAKLTLLHVWMVPVPAYAEALAWPVENLQAAAGEALARAHVRLQAARPDAEAVLAAGEPWEQILATAAKHEADVIVMGTHGRHGAPRRFLGSVAEKVVRHSPIPVLTVPAADR